MVNRIALREPAADAVFAAAQRDLTRRSAAADGIRAFHLVGCFDDVLVVVIMGDTEESINRLRDEAANEWMRENTVPHAAPPERAFGEVVMSYERGGPPASPGVGE